MNNNKEATASEGVRMAYKKPEAVKTPSKRENFSTGGNVKMVYGNGPNSLPECVSKPGKKKLIKG